MCLFLFSFFRPTPPLPNVENTNTRHERVRFFTRCYVSHGACLCSVQTHGGRTIGVVRLSLFHANIRSTRRVHYTRARRCHATAYFFFFFAKFTSRFQNTTRLFVNFVAGRVCRLLNISIRRTLPCRFSRRAQNSVERAALPLGRR